MTRVCGRVTDLFVRDVDAIAELGVQDRDIFWLWRKLRNNELEEKEGYCDVS